MDENVVLSKRFGRVTFFAATGNSCKPKDTCQKCLLRDQPECIEARCVSMLRTDGRNGYFSRHEMPEAKSGANGARKERP